MLIEITSSLSQTATPDSSGMGRCAGSFGLSRDHGGPRDDSLVRRTGEEVTYLSRDVASTLCSYTKYRRRGAVRSATLAKGSELSAGMHPELPRGLEQDRAPTGEMSASTRQGTTNHGSSRRSARRLASRFHAG